MLWILIEKSRRRLTLFQGGRPLFQCAVALGSCPEGAKERAGDGRTPEGRYRICLIKEQGKWGRSLGLDYPSPEDGERALSQGRIDRETLTVICKARETETRPPWGSPLGGEIYLHEGGTASDWTAGCIALDPESMDRIFPLREQVEWVEIRA